MIQQTLYLIWHFTLWLSINYKHTLQIPCMQIIGLTCYFSCSRGSKAAILPAILQDIDCRLHGMIAWCKLHLSGRVCVQCGWPHINTTKAVAGTIIPAPCMHWGCLQWIVWSGFLPGPWYTRVCLHMFVYMCACVCV